MLELYDRNLKRIAVLENAFDRTEERRLNGVGEYRFGMPADDPKAALLTPLSFVREEGGDYYRLIERSTRRGETGALTLAAEHALATLSDDLMFGQTSLPGTLRTAGVLREILSRQTRALWQLGACDFDRAFGYAFSSENLLSALFKVPRLFTDDYLWQVDMRQLPWTLSLKALDTRNVRFIVRAGHNLLSEESVISAAPLCTRLYLLGSGEGDDQVTIRPQNGQLPYLQSDAASIAKYGIISRLHVDRTAGDAATLLERGRALLKGMEAPREARTFEVADLYPVTGRDIDRAEPGDIARLAEDGAAAYVTGVTHRHDEPGGMALTLSSSPRDLTDDLIDLAEGQRVEQVYAQGASQTYATGMQGNATAQTPARARFQIPAQLRDAVRLKAKITLEPYRMESRLTGGALEPGIHRTGSPSSAQVSLGGAPLFQMGTDIEADLTAYIPAETIPRDIWLSLDVLPSDLAFIRIDLLIQGTSR